MSTNDILTAHVWRALCRMRCAQVGVDLESEGSGLDEVMTCCWRACNIRDRTEPKLGAGYFGNGVVTLPTEMSVRDLCDRLSIVEVALRLRNTLQQHGSAEGVAALTDWKLKGVRLGGVKPGLRFDSKALSFIVSSWLFPWEHVRFARATPTPTSQSSRASMPLCFGHGLLNPMVCVLSRRAETVGGGVDVWYCSPRDALMGFVEHLQKSIAV